MPTRRESVVGATRHSAPPSRAAVPPRMAAHDIAAVLAVSDTFCHSRTNTSSWLPRPKIQSGSRLPGENRATSPAVSSTTPVTPSATADRLQVLETTSAGCPSR